MREVQEAQRWGVDLLEPGALEKAEMEAETEAGEKDGMELGRMDDNGEKGAAELK